MLKGIGKGFEVYEMNEPTVFESIQELQARHNDRALKGPLAKVSQMILDNHLHTCLTTAVRGDDPDERERVLSEISEVFGVTNR